MSTSEDIAQIKAQEQALRFDHFNEEDAWTLGSLMRGEAARRGLPIAIEIRHAGRALFYAALPGSDADNPHWLRRKLNSVLRFHRSSYRLGLELEARGAVLGPERGADPAEYAWHGGGFPVFVRETGVIGAIAVSGLPQRDDHAFVVEMLCRFLGQDGDGLKLGLPA